MRDGDQPRTPGHRREQRVLVGLRHDDAGAAAAARCRELLEPLVEVVTPPGHWTLVTFRPPGDPAELVAALAERDVVVRELPGRNLVRVSCGWWTSEDDLRRLADGLRG